MGFGFVLKTNQKVLRKYKNYVITSHQVSIYSNVCGRVAFDSKERSHFAPHSEWTHAKAVVVLFNDGPCPPSTLLNVVPPSLLPIQLP